MTNAFTRALVLLLVALIAGCASLERQERELTWRVVKADAGWFPGLPAEVQDLYIPVGDAPDAPRINAWWWPADDPQAPAILYLHGARWNLTGHLRRIEQLRRFGFSVLAIDYRGFGKSDGDLPSEEIVYEDARVAGSGWSAPARRDAALHLRPLAGRRGGDRPGGARRRPTARARAASSSSRRSPRWPTSPPR